MNEGALSTTTHAAVKLSGYVTVNATDEQNPTIEFYSRIIAIDNIDNIDNIDTAIIRLNNSLLPQFNSFGTIQLIEI